MTSSMPPAPPSPPPPPTPSFGSGHPVALSIEHAPQYSRGLAVLGVPIFYGRLIALIPVLFVLLFVGIAAFVAGWIMQFAVLFTGRYPENGHTFVSGYLRLSTRTSSWLFGLTDKYPGFSIQPSPGPVQLSVVHAEQYSRGLAALGAILFIGRAIALFPVFVVLYFIRIAAAVVAWVMQFAVLFTGRYPEGAHAFVIGYLRLETRTVAWLFGLTDKYPGFSLQP